MYSYIYAQEEEYDELVIWKTLEHAFLWNFNDILHFRVHHIGFVNLKFNHIWHQWPAKFYICIFMRFWWNFHFRHIASVILNFEIWTSYLALTQFTKIPCIFIQLRSILFVIIYSYFPTCYIPIYWIHFFNFYYQL